MSQQITIEVSEKVFSHAATVALQKKQRLEDVLSDWLEDSVDKKPVEELSDAEVLALSQMKISDEQQEILSDLLYKNREGEITADEKRQLDELIELCEQGMVRKSEALRVAVERGLREPLRF